MARAPRALLGGVPHKPAPPDHAQAPCGPERGALPSAATPARRSVRIGVFIAIGVAGLLAVILVCTLGLVVLVRRQQAGSNTDAARTKAAADLSEATSRL